MKVLAGLAALAIVLIGSPMLTNPPGAAPRTVAFQVTDDRTDVIPPYILFEVDDWR
jgi:hypothetical protein